MFGVKSSNQPISGQFAEKLCEKLMEMQKQTTKDATNMSHNIILGGRVHQPHGWNIKDVSRNWLITLDTYTKR